MPVSADDVWVAGSSVRAAYVPGYESAAAIAFQLSEAGSGDTAVLPSWADVVEVGYGTLYDQQLSGVATTVRKLVDLAEPHGVEVCDTRKTVPHMRRLQKYAVRKGGATNHRMDLSETVLVKDNHKELAGGLENYLDLLTTDRSVIVEIHNMDELVILKDYRGTEDFDIDIVMLDNFEPTDVKTVVRDLPDEWTAEVSGGITTDNIQAYCSTGVDRVSVGAITHSFDSLDLSLSITPSRS